MSNESNPKENAVLAQALLSLQEDDDNPWDISDERLVAYCEGKLSAEEAAVVQECLTHNPQAREASVQIYQELARLASVAAASPERSLWQGFVAWVSSHKGLTFGGVGGTAITATFAFMMIVSTSVYKSFDQQFMHYSDMPSKPLISWQPRPLLDSDPNWKGKGIHNDFFRQAFLFGVRRGVEDFTQPDAPTVEALASITAPSPHCLSQLPIKDCKQIIRAGEYFGRWAVLANTQCQINADDLSADLASQAEAATTFLQDAGLGAQHPIQRIVDNIRESQDTTFQCAEVTALLSIQG